MIDEPMDVNENWPVALKRQEALGLLQDLLGEERTEQVWKELLAPLYDVMEVRRVYTLLMRCRYCGRPHPASPTGATWAAKGRPVPGHALNCRYYVGPLYHHRTGSHRALTGDHADCSCGRSYPDSVWDDPRPQCPDAALDWRGPRPVE